jgi:hypothetical protein
MLSHRKLTKPERAVSRAINAGRIVDLRRRLPEAPELNDAATGADWEKTRTVRAELLAELLTNDTGPGPIRALRLYGARISGMLDLEGATLVRPLILYGCYLENVINLQEARALSIRLPGCYLPGLYAAQLETRGDVKLTDGFTCHGEVSLAVAHVGGSLHCDGAKLINSHGAALNANGVLVGQSMRCGYGFLAEGLIDLVGARIDGQLVLNGARLVRPGGVALQADGLTVGSMMACSDGFVAEGEVRLHGARIRGPLTFSGATLEGGIYMPKAHVAGQLLFTGANLVRPGGVALQADGVTVDDMMACSNEFVAQGEVRAVGARLGGPLDFTRATLTNPGKVALRLRQLTTLDLSMEFQERPAGEVDLSFARVGSLNDSSSTWPQRGELRLRGLVHENLSAHPEIRVRDRLRWLHLTMTAIYRNPTISSRRSTNGPAMQRRLDWWQSLSNGTGGAH